MKNVAFFEVLKIPSFRSLWLAQAVSQIFLNLLMFLLIIRVYEITQSNSAVSILVFLIALPNVVLGALAGVLVDRWGRKAVMFFCHFLRIFAVLGFLLSSATIGWVYMLAFMISAITQFFFPAEAGTIFELVKDKKLLMAANSLFSMTFFGSVIIGNVLAGPFLQLFGAHGTFLMVAVAFAVASLFTAKIPGRLTLALEFHLQKEVGSLFSDFMFGIDHIYKTAAVQRAIVTMGASQITISILGTIAPGFADKVLGLPASSVSLMIMAPAAMGMGIAAMVVGQFFRKTNREKLIKFGFASATVALLLYSGVDKLAGLANIPIPLMGIFVVMLLGASNAFLDIPVNTLIQENTPEEIRSRVYGVVSSGIGVASIFPIFFSGAVADALGVRVVMILTGLAVLAFGSYNYFRKDASSPV